MEGPMPTINKEKRPAWTSSSDLDTTTSFPTDSDDSEDTLTRDDDYFASQVMGNGSSSAFQLRPPRVAASPETVARSLTIAEDLGHARIVLCQACIRRFIQLNRFRHRVKMNKRRDKIVYELLETEAAYVDSLNTVVEVYLQPLRDNLAEAQRKEGNSSPSGISASSSPSSASSALLSHAGGESINGESILPSQTTLKSLFSDIDVIRNYNTHLYRSLVQRYENWSPHTKIGDIFLTMNHFLKAYSNYCTHYKKALGTLGKLNKNPRFVAFIKNAANRPECEGRSLRDLLHLPVQRIPQYKAYLDDLVQHTWPTHVDRANLKEAARNITDLANYVIDSQTDVQHIIQVLNVQKRLTGSYDNIVNTTRRFIREGDLTEVNGKGRAVYHMFLFNDILLWTRRNPESAEDRAKEDSPKHKYTPKYRVKKKCDLLPMTAVKEVAVDIPGEAPEYGIKIDSKSHTFILIADTLKERKSWLFDLYACIDDAMVQHYFRLVEAQKRVVHQELLTVMSSHAKWAKLHNSTGSNTARHISPEKEGKKKRPLTIGRIMGRKMANDNVAPAPNTQTTQNPLLSSLSRSGPPTVNSSDQLSTIRRQSIGTTITVPDSGFVYIPDSGYADPRMLQKSVSTTQLDMLMAEMTHDPRRAIFLAPKLEHTMKRIQKESQLFDQQQKKPKKSHKFTRSISWTFKGSQHEETKRRRPKSAHDSKLRPRKDSREDREDGHEKDKDKEKEKEKEKESRAERHERKKRKKEQNRLTRVPTTRTNDLRTTGSAKW